MDNGTLRKTLAAACLAVVAVPFGVSAQEACSRYTVQPGDTLSSISRTAYGDYNFQRIFNANRDTIGGNPNLIEKGTMLEIPCLDGQVAADAESAEPAAPATAEVVEEAEPATEVAAEVATEPAAPATPAVAPLEKISFITGDDYPPFADEQLSGGGIITQLVRTAMVRANSGADVSIAFVNDWGAHLDTLLPSGAFDATFPWSLPDCSNLGVLTAADAYRCTDFAHSESFYDIVDGYFAMKGSGLEDAKSFDAFRGKRICRPDGHSLAWLSTAGLAEPEITLVRPVTVAECFSALAAGSVDVVHIEVQVAAEALDALGLKNEAIENPNLAHIKTLRVFVHKQNPNADEIIATINSGLAIMRQSGEWYDIVSAGLLEQARKVAPKS
ncbi:transporter substrate-binding domain-containing protein [Defluviimonas sp. WL0024]|uniref:Transporter substrate-binding domain-containing protein n=2 Tax=Albidovulum TaxID=205889 RepID=A0ABT3J3X0_9RHOB|nr:MULTISPECIES: transporter substrate-binding domain-containing protein [Defluviimonas]MCU9847895.1 transporter substrate-binding domain-containing protein [Defluviimonas sp. WL0024]MCW3782392.1 transporter substrate-binding domain-containing protein [Defluviimonas salinarum]